MKNIAFLFLKFGKYVPENKEKRNKQNYEIHSSTFSHRHLLLITKLKVENILDNVKHFMPDMHCIIEIL